MLVCVSEVWGEAANNNFSSDATQKDGVEAPVKLTSEAMVIRRDKDGKEIREPAHPGPPIYTETEVNVRSIKDPASSSLSSPSSSSQHQDEASKGSDDESSENSASEPQRRHSRRHRKHRGSSRRRPRHRHHRRHHRHHQAKGLHDPFTINITS